MFRLVYKFVSACISVKMICLICLLCNSCIYSEKTVISNGIIEIDVMSSLSKNRIVNLSDIASNIEYCMLETDTKCFISQDMSVYCSKEYIVAIGNQTPMHDVCYVFERNTGNFIRQISNRGQGPGDYTETIDFFWDSKNEQICLFGNNKYHFYNLDGTLSHQINRFSRAMNNFIALGDLYIGYVPNYTGNLRIRIAFYDKEGTFIDSVPNYRTWKKTTSSYSISRDSWFYNINDSLYFKEVYCDTLFHIKDFTLHAKYVFNTDGLTVPYEIRSRYNLMAALNNGGVAVDRFEKYVVILKIFEDHKYLYFTIEHRQFLYPAIYNKTNKHLHIMPPVSIPQRTGREWKVPLYGFENDLDGGLPFWPQQMISEKEMMCVYTVEELLGLDTSKITDAKLKNVLNSLEEDSNPVVAIVTLKD